MIELGKMQKLSVLRLTPVGAYLNAGDSKGDEDVLLPQSQVPPGTDVGSELDVFIYKDSEDRPIATVRRPKLILGELAVLAVAEINKIGAFLDWGLEKDLFLPYKEQVGDIKKGGSYLVGLYVDNSGRLCATMRVYSLLRSDAPYKAKDRVSGIVISLSGEWGCFVAVDNRYHGLVHTREMAGQPAVGDVISARVLKVRPDGKLELSMREPAYKEIEGDARLICDRLTAKGGYLPLNDDSPPEQIKAELGLSKGAFKRAVGRLLKEGAIKITEEGIKTAW